MVAVQQLLGARRAGRVEPRLITDADVPWMVELAHRRYSNRFDHQAGEMWVRGVVLRSPLMFWPMRTDNAFLIAMLSIEPWLPTETRCHVAMICADHDCMWEAVGLLRASIEWARRRRCAEWRIESATDFDLAPIALKLGAKEISPRHVLRL